MARELSSQAAAAKMIRKELKTAFPTVKFSVTSSSFSMGDDVHVSWTDGPTTDQVNAITSKYQYGHFDGMIDLYEYSNKRTDLPQTKYVMTRRDISRAIYAATIDLLNRRFGWDLVIHPEWNNVTNESDRPMDNGYGYRSHEIHRTLQDTPLVCTCGAATLPGDAYCPMCGAALTERDDLAA